MCQTPTCPQEEMAALRGNAIHAIIWSRKVTEGWATMVCWASYSIRPICQPVNLSWSAPLFTECFMAWVRFLQSSKCAFICRVHFKGKRVSFVFSLVLCDRQEKRGFEAKEVPSLIAAIYCLENSFCAKDRRKMFQMRELKKLMRCAMVRRGAFCPNSWYSPYHMH